MTGYAIVVGGLICLALLTVAVARPQLSLLALVALDVSNLNGVIAHNLGVSPYRPQLALAILILLIMIRRRMFSFAWSPVLLGLLVLFAGFGLSLATAADPVTSQALLIERTRDLLYFLVVFALLLSSAAAKPVAQATVLVLGALAGLTAVHEFVLGNQGDLFGLSSVPLVQEGGALTARHAGTSSDVNFWCRLLVMFVPLSLSLWAGARGRWTRLLWVGCVGALGVGVYLTQSRGGFIALFVAVLVWLSLAGGRYRRSLWFVPPLVAVLVPLTGIGSRLLTLTSLFAGPSPDEDLSVLTRRRLQLDALRMFMDSPVTGHGIGSYGTLFPHYDRLSDYYQPVDIVVAAHNFYLEQAADGGFVLVLAWLIFFGTVGFAALRARALADRAGDLTVRFLAVGVFAGLVGWLIASVFLHLSDFRALLVIAGLAAALDVRARLMPPRAEVLRQPSPAVPLSRRVGLGAAAVLTISAVGALGVLTTGTVTYRSSATLAVVPAGAVSDPAVAYQLDVVSRGLIAPTLAAAIDPGLTSEDLTVASGRPVNGPVTVGVTQSRLGGAVVVTVTAGDPATASALSATAVELVEERVATLNSRYRLSGAAAAPESVPLARRWGVVPFGLLMLGASGVLLRRSRLRSRRFDAARARYRTEEMVV